MVDMKFNANNKGTELNGANKWEGSKGVGFKILQLEEQSQQDDCVTDQRGDLLNQ